MKVLNPKISALQIQWRRKILTNHVKYVSTKHIHTSPARSEHCGTSPGSALVTTPSPPGYEPPEVVHGQIKIPELLASTVNKNQKQYAGN